MKTDSLFYGLTLVETMLLRLIERKFGPPSERVQDQFNQADAETLLHWSERLLMAQSLEEVLH